MLKVLAVCGNGMGTSAIIKMRAEKALSSHKVNCKVEACSTGQVGSRINNYDVVLAQIHLAGQLKAKGSTKIIPLKNLMDAKEMETKLVEALNISDHTRNC